MKEVLFSKRNAILFLLGAIGVLSSLPMIPQMAAITNEPVPIPMILLQAISGVQSLVFLSIAVVVGAYCVPRVGLNTPLIDGKMFHVKTVLVSIVGGVLGAGLILLSYSLFEPHLPAVFLENGETLTPPWFTKLLYGGITEEILMRWGVMSLLVWIPYRIFQQGTGAVKPQFFVAAILISSLLFGVGHLPVATVLASELTGVLVAYIVIANSLFGVIAGILFWKRGLESAILAHMIAHVVMMSVA